MLVKMKVLIGKMPQFLTALCIGAILGGFVTTKSYADEPSYIKSQGVIKLDNEVVFDAEDFKYLERAYLKGKEALRIDTIEAVKAAPQDYGISGSFSSIKTSKGIAGSSNAGNQFYASIPEGYDFALIIYSGYDDYGLTKYAGSLVATTAAGRSGGGVYLVPLNGNATGFYVYGKWGTSASVVAIKMQ